MEDIGPEQRKLKSPGSPGKKDLIKLGKKLPIS
jgi:hypothetical protein